jgi:hypothetical protein
VVRWGLRWPGRKPATRLLVVARISTTTPLRPVVLKVCSDVPSGSVPCVSGFTEFYYLVLFPDFKGVNDLC